MTSFVAWLATLNIKRNVTSMFVNMNYRYTNIKYRRAVTLEEGRGGKGAVSQ